MPFTHGYNTLTTGLVYNYNDQQAILSLRKLFKVTTLNNLFCCPPTEL